jgi:hypothetical protein
VFEEQSPIKKIALNSLCGISLILFLGEGFYFYHMKNISPDKRFEIHLFTRDDDSYFYSNTDYYWYITSVETGDELFSFSGSDSQDSNGSKKNGVEHVDFMQNGLGVIVLNSEGSQESFRLPSQIDIVEGGKKLRLTFPDGTKNEVPRKKLMHFSKYGQPFTLPIKNDPDQK